MVEGFIFTSTMSRGKQSDSLKNVTSYIFVHRNNIIDEILTFLYDEEIIIRYSRLISRISPVRVSSHVAGVGMRFHIALRRRLAKSFIASLSGNTIQLIRGRTATRLDTRTRVVLNAIFSEPRGIVQFISAIYRRRQCRGEIEKLSRPIHSCF